MENELASLRRDMVLWRRVILNIEGVWLYLATLGCWSLPPDLPRIVALSTTAFLFAQRVLSRGKDRRSFPQRRDDLKQQIIRNAMDDGERQALLDELATIESEAGSIKELKYSIPYIICMLFWLYSLYYAINSPCPSH